MAEGTGSTQQSMAEGTGSTQGLRENKIFNDPIYGPMELDPLLVAIINTPEFNRLRYIKQLGGNYYVYPGASHNRFEHCIGVSFLAGKMIEALQRNELPGVLNITPVDILCVKVAGLCHDLGHGPYSHLFEKQFLRPLKKHVKHEDLSCAILDRIFSAMEKKFEDAGLKQPEMDIIKELIIGKKPGEEGKLAKNKRFLYEIVANKYTEIDVDKWDYFTRDCHALGLKHGFDYQRLLYSAKVMEYNGETRIVYRDKVKNDIYELFYTRTRLYKAAYQHRVSCCIEIMIGEALRLAHSGGYTIQYWDPTKEGLQSSSLLDAANLDNLLPYLELSDDVVKDIMLKSHTQGCHPHLVKAGNVLERFLKRELYVFVCEMSQDKYKQWEEILAENNDVVIHKVTFEDIMEPEQTLLYRKGKESPPIPLSTISETAEEQVVRVYHKKDKEAAEILRKSIEDTPTPPSASTLRTSIEDTPTPPSAKADEGTR